MTGTTGHLQDTENTKTKREWDSSMMTSSNGNICRFTGPLCREFTSHRWIPPQRPVRRSFDVFLGLRLNKWLSKQLWHRDLRHHFSHYDITVMMTTSQVTKWLKHGIPIPNTDYKGLCIQLHNRAASPYTLKYMIAIRANPRKKWYSKNRVLH